MANFNNNLVYIFCFLTKLIFNVPLSTKYIILGMLFPANLLAGTEKSKIKASRNTINNKISLG